MPVPPANLPAAVAAVELNLSECPFPSSFRCSHSSYRRLYITDTNGLTGPLTSRPAAPGGARTQGREIGAQRLDFQWSSCERRRKVSGGGAVEKCNQSTHSTLRDTQDAQHCNGLSNTNLSKYSEDSLALSRSVLRSSCACGGRACCCRGCCGCRRRCRRGPAPCLALLRRWQRLDLLRRGEPGGHHHALHEGDKGGKWEPTRSRLCRRSAPPCPSRPGPQLQPAHASMLLPGPWTLAPNRPQPIGSRRAPNKHTKASPPARQPARPPPRRTRPP